jgi:hypothetical protein
VGHVARYIRREAVLSSQIEGTQSALESVAFAIVNKLVAQLARLGLLDELTGGHRNRV